MKNLANPKKLQFAHEQEEGAIPSRQQLTWSGAIQRLLHATTALLLLANLPVTKADTCPLLAGGAPFGPTEWRPDGSADERTYYRYITSDDFMQLDSIFYCLDKDTQTHFQGFVATFKNTEDGTKQALPYGQTSTGDDVCTGFYVRDEIQWIRIKQDLDDIEGLIIGNTITSNEYAFTTTDIANPDDRDVDLPLTGRIIGFGVTIAQNTREIDQIMRISVVYNSCNCVGSTFLTEDGPTTMSLVAGIDTEVVQTLSYRENVIEKWYGQDCGGQTIELIAQISPTPLDIALSQSGALSIKGEVFTDTLRVGAATVDLIGRWNFAAQWGQVAGQGSTNKNGSESLMANAILPFYVQVDPCPIDSFITNILTDEYTYTVGDGVLNSQTYTHEQSINCGYELNYSVENGPSFVTVDSDTQQLVIETENLDDAGVYVVTFVATLPLPTDYSKTSFNNMRAETVVTLNINRLPPGCDTAIFDNFAIENLEVSVNGDLEIFQLETTQDSESKIQGNGDGFSYCGERSFSIVNLGDVQNFVTLDETNLLTIESTASGDIGQYQVKIKIHFVRDESVGNSQTMTVTVNPCKVLSYSAIQTLNIVDYIVDSGSKTTEQYQFQSEPQICSDITSYEISGAPIYMQHNESEKHFEIDSSDTQSEQFEVKVTGKIEYFTDYTMQDKVTVSDSFTFTLIVENLVDCSVTNLDFSLENMLANVYNPATVQALPVVQDSSEGKCGEISFEIIDEANHIDYLYLDTENSQIVLEGDDRTDEGLHAVQIRAFLVSHPDIGKVVDINVQVDPCRIGDTTSISLTDIEYTIGTGDVLTDSLQIIIDPIQCNYYAPGYRYVGLPSFIEQSGNRLLLNTNTRRFAGEYTVQVGVQYSQYIDFNRVTFVNSQLIFGSFQLTIWDPCIDTVLEPFSMDDVIYSVLQSAYEQPVPLQTNDSISQIYGTKDGYSLCGHRIFTVTDTSQVSNFLTINSSKYEGSLDYYSSSIDSVGQYNLEVSIQMNDYRGQIQKASWIVTVNPCEISSFIGTVTPVEQTYPIIASSYTITTFSYAFEQDMACGYSQTIVALNVPSFVTHNTEASNFSVQTDELDQVGEYNIQVQSTIQVPTDWTQASKNDIVEFIDFTLTVIATCEATSFLDWELDGEEFNNDIKGGLKKFSITTVDDTVSFMKGIQDGQTFCGNRIYSIVDDSAVSSFFSIDNNTKQFILNPTSNEDLGLHVIDIEASLENWPSKKQTSTVSIFVNPCQIKSFQGAFTPQTNLYEVGADSLKSFSYEFTQINACGYTESYEVLDLPNFVNHNTITKDFSIKTDELTDVGSFTITVQTTIQAPSSYLNQATDPYVSQASFTLIVDATCVATEFVDWDLSSKSFTSNVLGEQIIHSIGSANDRVSQINGNKDGTSFCGDRVYRILDDSQVSSFLTVDSTSGSIILQPRSHSEEGQYNIDIEVSLKDHPSIKEVSQAIITVNPCQVTILTSNVTPSTEDYETASSRMTSFSYIFAQTNACDYDDFVEIIEMPEFVTHNSIAKDFSVETDKLQDVGPHVIKFQSTVQVPTDFTRAQSISVTKEAQFTVNIVATCDVTQFVNWNIPNIRVQSYVKGDQVIRSIGPVDDAVSLMRGNQDGVTFCGTRVFRILDDSAVSSFLSIESSAQQIVLQPTEDTQEGEYTIDIEVSLEEQPDIKEIAQIIIQIDPCQVSSFTGLVNPISQSYGVATDQFTSFSFLFEQQASACDYNESIQIDNMPSFVTYNEDQRDFSIYTDTFSDVGQFTVTITSTIQVPSDYTRAVNNKVESSVEFTLSVVASCEGAMFVDWSLPNSSMESFIKGNIVTQAIGPVQDTVSRIKGNQDGVTHCGKRLYRIIDDSEISNFLSIDSIAETLVLQPPTQDTNEGVYSVQVEVSLEEQPEISQVATVTITVNPCQITSFIGSVTPATEAYEVSAVETTSFKYQFDQTNSCGYKEVIEVVGQPSFVTHNSNEKDFKFITNALSDVNDYTITVQSTIQVPTDHTRDTYNPVKAQVEFVLDVVAICDVSVFVDWYLDGQEYMTNVLGASVSDSIGPVEDRVSQINGNQDGMTFCGNREYRIIDQASVVNFLTLDSTTETFTLNALSDNDIGFYEVQVEVSLSSYPSIKEIATVQITVDPCQISSFTGSVASPNQIYLVQATPLNSFSYIFEQTNACGYEESIVFTQELPSIIQHNSESKDFTISTDKLTDVGQYTVSFVSTIMVPSDFTLTIFNPVTAQIDFTLDIEATCEVTKFMDWTLKESTSFQHYVKAVATQHSIGPVDDSVSRINGNQDGLSFCGPRVYRIINAENFSSFLTIDSVTQTISIHPDSNLVEGIHLVDIEVSLQDYQQIKETVTLTITINPCQVTLITGSVLEAPLSYSVDTPQTVGGIYSFTQTLECEYEQTITTSVLPAFVTHNEEDFNFSVVTDNPLDEDEYTVTVTSTIQVPNDYLRNTFTEVTGSVNFEIIVQEECGETILDDLILTDMIVFDEGVAGEQSFEDVKDLVSKQFGNLDGTSFCGARNYEIVDAEQHASYLSLTDKTIKVLSTEDASIGTHQIQLKVYLNDQPSIFKVSEFSITVNPCEITVFEISSGPEDTDYTIEAVEKLLGSLVTNQGLCSYQVTYETAVAYPFLIIDQSSGEVKVQTNDRTQEQEHQIQIIAQINVPEDHTMQIFSEQNSQVSFSLNIVDPCHYTQLDELILNEMITSVKGIESEQIFDQVQDSYSKVSGDNSGLTFCGPRLYSIVDIPPYMSINEERQAITLSTSSDTHIGQFELQVLVQLQDFSEITKIVKFTVTINPCIISDYTSSVLPISESYTINLPAATTFDYIFTQTNACGYPETISVDKTFEFLTHNELNQDFTIESGLREFTGIYSVSLSSTIIVPDDFRLETETQHSTETSFELTMIDPCATTEFLEDFQISDIQVKVHDQQLDEQFASAKDSISQVSGNMDGLTYCGSRSYELLDKEAHQSYLTFSERTVSVHPQNDSEMGVYQIQVRVSLDDYPTITKIATFMLTINPCVVEVFEFASGPADTDYVIEATEKSLGRLVASQGVCTYQVTYELVTQMSFISINQDKAEVLVQTDDYAFEMVHQVQIRGKIQVPKDLAQIEFDELNNVFSFELELFIPIDPCTITRFQELVLSNMETVVLGSADLQTFDDVKDTESIKRGDKSGLTFCGPRIYSMVEDHPYISIDSTQRRITLLTTDQSNVGLYNIELLMLLEDYPDVTSKVLIQVIIQPCAITEFSGSIQPNQQSYIVYEEALTTFSYSFTQTNLCGYKQNIYFKYNDNSDWIESKQLSEQLNFLSHNDDNQDFTISSELREDVGDYTIRIASSIEVPYDYSSNKGRIDQAFITFNLSIQDPCADTLFQEFIIPDILIKVHDLKTEEQTPQVEDSVSLLVGNKDGLDYCGERSYELINAQSHQAYLNFADTTMTVLSDDDSEIGNYPVQIQVSLNDYPEILKVADFTIIVNPCDVSSFDFTEGPLDQDYIIEGPELSLGFLQTNQGVCTYAVTYELVNPKSFISIDQVSGEVKVQTDEFDDEDNHSIEIRATIQVPKDSIQVNVFTEIETTYSFMLDLILPIDPCTMSVFDDLNLMDMTSIVLGDASSQTFEEVKDFESKRRGDESGITFCGPRIYTIVGSPSYIEIDSDQRQITLSTKSGSDVGQFQIQLKMHLKDYPSIESTVQFMVTLNPCQIFDYSASINPTQISYEMDDTEITTFAYQFTQTNSCGYDQTISVDKSLNFFTHNAENQDFTIYSDSRNDIGSHAITVSSIIMAPDDHTLSTETEHLAQATFTVDVLDPCDETLLFDFTIPSIYSYYPSEIKTEELPFVSDSKGQNKPNRADGQPYCAERVYEIITPDSEFLSIVDGKFAFDTNKVEMNTDYTVQVRVGLKDYPSIAPVMAQVACKVNTCKLDDLLPAKNIEQIYYIRTREIQVDFNEFTQGPDCGYPITYTFKQVSGSDLPVWMQSDGDERSLKIETQDINDQGQYTVEVTGSTPQGYLYGSVESTMLIVVDAKFDCAQDEILSLNQIPEQIIALRDASVPFRLTTTYTQILESCPETFTLQKLSQVGWQTLNSFESSIISVDAQGTILIDTQERELDDIMWSLRYIVTNSASNQSQEAEFDVNFVDACWNADLEAVKFDKNEYIFVLYRDDLKINFSAMTVSMDCGGIFYELNYVSGPLKNRSSIDVLESSIESELQDRQWIGSHRIKITGYNGIRDSESPYGVEGVFLNIISEIITVKVLDPCVDTVINSNNEFPDSLMVQSGLNQEILELTGPTNSISTVYGNGYNQCGSLQYQIYNEEGNALARTSHFFLTSATDLENGDPITLRVDSAPGNGSIITEYFTIKINLRQISQVDALFIPISISYRECDVVEYKAPKIDDLSFTYQSFDPVVIFFNFDESPCAFKQSYEAHIVQGSSEMPLPEFIHLSESDASLTISQPKSFTVLGDYQVTLKSVLGNAISQESSTTFMVSIINEKIDVPSYSVMPEFQLHLSNRVVTVGHSLNYLVTFSQITGINDNGDVPFYMKAQLNMNKIKKFAEYNETTSLMHIDGNSLSNEDVGFYTIDVSATFTNGTHSKIINDKFRLEVRAQQSAKPPVPGPDIGGGKQDKDSISNGADKVIYISDWEGLVENANSQKEFSKKQPIPYVDSLTECGILTIKWDREMQEIQNITILPPTEVMIRETMQRNLQNYILGDSDDGQERVQVKKAIEINLIREYKEDKSLDWYVIESTKDQFQIQIEFNPEDLMTESSEVAFLNLTFWGTEFFKSRDENVSIRLGTNLYVQVYNQITSKQFSEVTNYEKSTRVAIVTFLILMIPFCPLGALIPTWMFVNTLQLLSHLPLMNAQLPPTVNSVLLKMLSYAKLDWLGFKGQANSRQFDQVSEQYSFNDIRLACGYTDQYAQCILTATFIAALVSVLQILLSNSVKLYHKVQKTKATRLSCFSVSNLTIRIFYVLFLELFMSLVIIIGFSEQTTASSKFISFFVLALVIGLIGLLLFILIIGCGMGPQTEHLYEKWTVMSSFMEMRPLMNKKGIRDLVVEDTQLKAFSQEINAIREKKEAREALKNVKCLETQATQRNLLAPNCVVETLPTGRDTYDIGDFANGADSNQPIDIKLDKDNNIPLSQSTPGQLSNKSSRKVSSNNILVADEIVPCDMDFEQKLNLISGSGRNQVQNSYIPTPNINEQEFEERTKKTNIRPRLPTGMGNKKKSRSIDTFEPSSVSLGTSKSVDNIPAVDSQLRVIEEYSEEEVPATATNKRSKDMLGNNIIQQMQRTGGFSAMDRSRSHQKSQTPGGANSCTTVTDEFLSDKKSVMQIEQANFRFSDGDQTPKKGGRAFLEKKILSSIRETEDILLRKDSQENDDQQYEGGEQESNGSIKLPANQSDRAEENQYTPRSQSKSSMCNPQSIKSSSIRARTKLNQRGIDIADQHDLFEKRQVVRNMSESLRVDHGFGKIIARDLDVTPAKDKKVFKMTSKGSFSNFDQGVIIRQQDSQSFDNEDVILDPKLIAKIKVKMEGQIQISGRYKTLFYGLKKNQERNSQILYPIAFILRRIIFVISIVIFVNQPIFAVLTFLCLTLIMLVYSIHEHQWQDSLINKQNIFNETVMYIIATLFFICRGEFALDMYNSVSDVMLTLIVLLITVNGACMIYTATRIGILFAQRLFYLKKQTQRKIVKKALHKELQHVAETIVRDRNISIEQNNDFAIKIQDCGEEVQEKKLVEVQESRTSFWSRLFKNRSSDVNVIEDVTFAANDVIHIVTSDSGGFQGQYKNVNHTVHGLIDIRDDQNYDPMGVFTVRDQHHHNQINQQADLMSRESGFNTQPDRLGLSEFEFQSQTEMNTQRSLGIQRDRKTLRHASSDGRNTHLEYLSGPLEDQSLEYELKTIQSPDDKLVNRRKSKAYLLNDLNPISQVRSVDEGTPSPQKGLENCLAIEQELLELDIEDEVNQCQKEGELQINCFEEEMNRATLEEQIKTFQIEEEALDNDADVEDAEDDLKQTISVVDEVDEISAQSKSKPDSIKQILENTTDSQFKITETEASAKVIDERCQANIISSLTSGNHSAHDLHAVKIEIESSDVKQHNFYEKKLSSGEKSLISPQDTCQKNYDNKKAYNLSELQSELPENMNQQEAANSKIFGDLTNNYSNSNFKDSSPLVNGLNMNGSLTNILNKVKSKVADNNMVDTKSSGDMSGNNKKIIVQPKAIPKGEKWVKSKSRNNQNNASTTRYQAKTDMATAGAAGKQKVLEQRSSLERSENLTIKLMQMPNMQPTTFKNGAHASELGGSVADRFVSPEKQLANNGRLQHVLTENGKTFSIMSHVAGTTTGRQAVNKSYIGKDATPNRVAFSPPSKLSTTGKRVTAQGGFSHRLTRVNRQNGCSQEEKSRLASMDSQETRLQRTGQSVINVVKKNNYETQQPDQEEQMQKNMTKMTEESIDDTLSQKPIMFQNEGVQEGGPLVNQMLQSLCNDQIGDNSAILEPEYQKKRNITPGGRMNNKRMKNGGSSHRRVTPGGGEKKAGSRKRKDSTSKNRRERTPITNNSKSPSKSPLPLPYNLGLPARGSKSMKQKKTSTIRATYLPQDQQQATMRDGSQTNGKRNPKTVTKNMLTTGNFGSKENLPTTHDGNGLNQSGI